MGNTSFWSRNYDDEFLNIINHYILPNANIEETFFCSYHNSVIMGTYLNYSQRNKDNEFSATNDSQIGWGHIGFKNKTEV